MSLETDNESAGVLGELGWRRKSASSLPRPLEADWGGVDCGRRRRRAARLRAASGNLFWL